MPIGSICVQDTDYGRCFQSVRKNTVFLLDEKLAASAWDHEVCAGSSSYFNLPDDCWLVFGKAVSIGRWMEAYNNDDNEILEQLLRAAVDWPDNTFIKFFAKKKIVFRTHWCDFLKHWDEFIAFEDDCPIVIPENFLNKEALLFRPIGDVIKVADME